LHWCGGKSSIRAKRLGRVRGDAALIRIAVQLCGCCRDRLQEWGTNCRRIPDGLAGGWTDQLCPLPENSATGRQSKKGGEAAVIPDVARRRGWRGHRRERGSKPQERLRHSICPSFRPQRQVERRKFIVHVIVTSCEAVRKMRPLGFKEPQDERGKNGRHSSDVNLKLRRAAAVARSSRRVRNSMRPSAILKSSRWMRPQSQHCSRKLRMRGRVHSPYEMTRYRRRGSR